MKSKLDLFPSVYCVSLVESKQRRRNLISQFKEYGISDINFSLSERLAESGEWWVGDEYIDNLCDAGKSTCINHIRNIYDWYTNTDDAYGFFCEDDISLETVKYWNFTWSEFINALPPDWECVQLYSIRTHNNYPINQVRLRVREWYDWGAQAFIIKRSYAKKVLDAYYPGRVLFKLVSINETPFNDGYISPYLHKCPYPENLLFTGLGQVLNIPLILEGIDLETTYSKDFVEKQKEGHDTSYNSIRNWWLENQNTELASIMKLKKPGQIIDCFMYYDERELLDLRIKLLNPHVDKFLIFEGNRYFSGIPKQFTCKQVLNELGIQNDKIEIIEVDLPADEQLQSAGLDHYMKNVCTEQGLRDVVVGYWTRERIQRDAFLLKRDEFDEDDVFIFSNCDEILDPKHLSYLPTVIRNNRHLVLKLPLVRLQTRANLREYYRETNEVVLDDKGAYICMKHHFNECSPAQIRASCNLPFAIHYAVDNNKRIEDIGWHFTRQGKTETPYEDDKIFVQPYSESLLPSIIHKLPEVKKLLLPQSVDNLQTIQNKLKGLPAVNCISLEHDKNKRNILINAFKKYNIDNINFCVSKTIDGTNDVWECDYTGEGTHPQHLSISINHIKNIKRWYEQTNEEYGFFCEDDLSLETVQYWDFTWLEFINALPPDWECIQLCNIRTQYNPITELKLTNREWYDWGAQAFILTRSYAKKIIDTYCKDDGTYKLICPKPDTLPVPENVLFVGTGKVLNLPMFVETFNVKHEHFINVIKSLWKSQQYTGCLESIMNI